MTFIGLMVTSGIILGSRVTEYRRLSVGVGWIAMLLVVVGIFLLASFFLRPWRSMHRFATHGRPSWRRDLWDDQLDG
jgi:hypothetical protein